MTTEERLEKMERELARVKCRYYWLLAAVGLVVGVCALVWFGTGFARTAQAQDAKKVVRANEFVLEDENGKHRAVLSASKENPGLCLYDENGKPRAMLGMSKVGSGLDFFDENGKCRASFGVAKDGPKLALHDENGNGRAALGVAKGMAGLFLFDEKVKIRALLGVDKDRPGLTLFDENGKVIGQVPTQPAETTKIQKPSSKGDWTDRANWRNLKKGMTKDEVRTLLGEPGKVDVYLSFEVWHYDYPSRGSVHFSKDGKVESWSEP
jgi:hypothetical protein